jgi:hypothetical protein
LSHYAVEKSHKYKVDGVAQVTISEPVVNADDTRREWQALKAVVKAEQYIRDPMELNCYVSQRGLPQHDVLGCLMPICSSSHCGL